MKTLIWVVIIGIIGFGAYWWWTHNMADTPTPPANETHMDGVDGDTGTEGSSQLAPGEEPFPFTLTATLGDATENTSVRGITVLPATTGTVQAGWDGERFMLSGEFSDLPEQQDDDFYEGWIVREAGVDGEMSVISTGALEWEVGMMYTNLFFSDTDLTDHATYILTIEPNDGDPAPADHVLVGELI